MKNGRVITYYYYSQLHRLMVKTLRLKFSESMVNLGCLEKLRLRINIGLLGKMGSALVFVLWGYGHRRCGAHMSSKCKGATERAHLDSGVKWAGERSKAENNKTQKLWLLHKTVDHGFLPALLLNKKPLYQLYISQWGYSYWQSTPRRKHGEYTT